MNITQTNPFQMAWFQVKPIDSTGRVQGNYAVLKPEHQEDFQKACAARRAEDMAALEAFRAEVKNSEPIRLTDEQKAALSEKYDPTDMTRDEYMSFVDDLCEYGILKDDDRGYIQASRSGLVRLDYSELGMAQISRIPENAGIFSQFESCGGNVLDWARYMAGFASYSQATRGFEPTRSAILFGRIGDVLQQIR